MDRYQRVERPRPESSAINENEIRITTQGLIRNYIAYANTLLQEKHAREIVLKAMGQAISKAVAIAEIIKKRTVGLHQDTAISSTSITDVWEPIEEGLLPLEMTRHVSMISISLSTRELNKNSPGYQPPLYVEQPRPQRQYQQQQQYQAKQAPDPSAEGVEVGGGEEGEFGVAEAAMVVGAMEAVAMEADMVEVMVVDMMVVMVVGMMAAMEEGIVMAVAMETTKRMVDGTTTVGIGVVEGVEVGDTVVQDMKEDVAMVGEGDIHAAEAAGWSTEGEGIRVSLVLQ